MTMEAIDAFTIGTKPTPEQVAYVWNQHPAPSSRIIHDLLERRGCTISWRTICRWKKNGWAQGIEGKGKATISERQHAPGEVRQSIRAELRSIPATDVAAAAGIAAAGGLEAAIEGGKLTVDDYARLELQRTELLAKTEPELMQIQSKERVIMNILMMREAARRAHVMVLIPKETGSFIEAMTDADKAGSSLPVIEGPIAPGGNGHANGHDPKLIDGTVNDASPLSQAIRQLRERVA